MQTATAEMTPTTIAAISNFLGIQSIQISRAIDASAKPLQIKRLRQNLK
ncbi:MAG TPA: hypothetical protein VGE35_01965 [Candidatus Paceibacterota bacterium]